MNLALQEPSAAWGVAAASACGRSHAARGTPNQDAFAYRPGPDPASLIAAVADGHGDAAYFRSDIGARCAVETALAVLSGARAAELAADGGLGSQIVAQWRGRIDAHLQAHPFSLNEARIVERAHRGLGIYEAYGSTLVAVLAGKDDVLYAQLGDGDLLRVTEHGTTTRIFEKAPGLARNETHSLCSPDAAERLRVRHERVVDRDPALIVASTDGYANSFASDAGFLQVGGDLLQMIAVDGLAALSARLPAILKETSDGGSRDDTTAVVLMRRGKTMP